MKPQPKPSTPCVTLFTDASVSAEHGIAAWAAWARYRAEDPTMRRSGLLPAERAKHVADMTFVEAYAIHHGLLAAWEAFSPPAGTLAVIQTDNPSTAALLLGQGKPAFLKRYAAAHEPFAAFVAANGIRLSIRLVTGHKGTATPRNAVNTWCDRESRRRMREARAELTATKVTEPAA